MSFDRPDEWFRTLSSGGELPPCALRGLQEDGFTIIAGPIGPEKLAQLSAAYDRAIASADPDEVREGSTTTRVHDFVNRGEEFDELYVHGPILDACCRILGRPFRLSSMLARTVRSRSTAQTLHVDFEHDTNGPTMVGFIFMVDAFDENNGATRFVPGSHKYPKGPDFRPADSTTDHRNSVVACGPAGTFIIYDGAVWHGHSANQTDRPRRSIQGAFVRREAGSDESPRWRMHPATLARISPLARYLLEI